MCWVLVEKRVLYEYIVGSFRFFCCCCVLVALRCVALHFAGRGTGGLNIPTFHSAKHINHVQLLTVQYSAVQCSAVRCSAVPCSAVPIN